MATIREISFEDDLFTFDVARELAAHVNEFVELELDRQPLGVNGMAALAFAPLRNMKQLYSYYFGYKDVRRASPNG